MTSLIEESLGPQPRLDQRPSTQVHDALAEGTAVLSGDETVTFRPYVKKILPADGWVFWVSAALLTAQQLASAGLRSADPVSADGSLHYASIGSMDEDESIIVRKVDFSSMSPVRALAEAAPTVLWVATWNAATDVEGNPLGPFRFTFSSRNAFYEEAGESHYVGDAVYPVFDQLMIDSNDQYSDRLVVSNSLPIWLALGTDVPFPAEWASNVPLYPAFLVPDNLSSPYGAVHVQFDRALQPTPLVGLRGDHSQLCRDRVTITLYGLRNDEALDFQDYLIEASILTDLYGFADMPMVKDAYRGQVELSALAMKKTVEFTANYDQLRSRDVARQLIRSAPLLDFGFNSVPVRQYAAPAFNA